MKKFLALIILTCFVSCKHDKDDNDYRTYYTNYPCNLNSPNPTYVDAKRVIKTYCVGCHSNDTIGRYLQYDQLNNACNNGSFNKRVFLKRDMPPANASQMDTCDYIILRRWFMNGHNPY